MKKTNSNEKRIEFRKKVADEFIKALEEDGLKWKKGWDGVVKFPYNPVTGNEYKGINAIILLLTGKKYKDPRWLTYNQMMSLNKVLPEDKQLSLKGEKATTIEYWFAFDKIEKKTMTFSQADKLIKSGVRDTEDIVPLPKYHSVFNAKQIKNYPELEVTYNLNIDSELINKLAKEMGVTLENDGGNNAYYNQFSDSIHLPEPKMFHTQHEYDFTALHELSHATGHESRLARDLSARFGSKEYAYEELVAEISSCFVGFNLTQDISEHHMNNHKAYIKNWIEIIKDKPDTLINAISEAQKASDYIEKSIDIITKKEMDVVVGSLKQKLEELEEDTKMQEYNEKLEYFESVFESNSIEQQEDEVEYEFSM